MKEGIAGEEKKANDIKKELEVSFDNGDELNNLIRRKSELDSKLDLDRQSDDAIGLKPEPEPVKEKHLKINL